MTLYTFMLAMEVIYALVDAASDAILIANASTGDIAYTNHAADKLFECERNELIGYHISQLHPAEELDDIMKKFASFVATDDYKETTAHILTKTGKKKLVLISSASHVNIGATKYSFAYFKDITLVEKIAKNNPSSSGCCKKRPNCWIRP